MTNKNLTEIIYILDRSGSMSSVMADTIGGFNTFVDGQKELEDNMKFTLVQFDHDYQIDLDCVDIKEVGHLGEEIAYMPRGSTALLDAVGRTISSVGERLSNTKESNRPGKVMFVIQTDGQENNSKEYNNTRIKEMIENQKNDYSWEFLFLSASSDVFAQGSKIGINPGMTFSYNPGKTQTVFAALNTTVGSYRGGDLNFTSSLTNSDID